MPEILEFDFMRRALLAAVLVGAVAPVVGVFVVQRRLSLIGDGIGHVALTGVAVGLLTGTAPTWVALATAVAAAVVLELARTTGRASADLALAMLFYSGIAGGVVLVSLAPAGNPANLVAFLFGAITTTTAGDVAAFTALAVVLLAVLAVLGRALYAVGDDEEYARASGLPVVAVNLVLSVLVAATVVLSMRVVGLLLISALMVVPVAVAQLTARSFAATVGTASAVGAVAATGGTVVSYYADTPTGGTIVLGAVAWFALAVVATAGYGRLRALLRRRQHDREQVAAGRGSSDQPPAGTPADLPAPAHAGHVHGGPDCDHPRVPHGDHVDYVHDGHRHAPRLSGTGIDYDEH